MRFATPYLAILLGLHSGTLTSEQDEYLEFMSRSFTPEATECDQSQHEVLWCLCEIGPIGDMLSEGIERQVYLERQNPPGPKPI